jgi:very-short-patch-repair endonuclease
MADIERARQLRKDETRAEKLVWKWLRARRFPGQARFRWIQ